MYMCAILTFLVILSAPLNVLCAPYEYVVTCKKVMNTPSQSLGRSTSCVFVRMDFLLHCIMRAKGVARKVHQGTVGIKMGKWSYLGDFDGLFDIYTICGQVLYPSPLYGVKLP